MKESGRDSGGWGKEGVRRRRCKMLFVLIHLGATLRCDCETGMWVQANGQVDAIAGEKSTAVSEEEEEGY